MSDINVTVQDEIVNIDVLDTPVLVNVVNSPGQQGPAGPGVPVGGTAGQVLAKNSSTNYDTVWVNQSGGVPYTGATGNVNLGEYELKAGQVTLDTSPTGTAAVGTTRWNDTTGVSETTLKGGSVLLRNGVDLVARVVNKVTPNTTLTKAAYQAVRVSGAQGQRLAIALAQANNDTNSADTIGLVIETIPTNQEGFIMAVGQLEGINTTGSLQGETWVDGDVLYLSPTIAGAITNVKPTGGGHIVVIGYVEYAHQNNGKIYVKVMNGWELEELHDVDIVTPANNQGLFYESSTSLWKNKSIPTVLGYTPEQPLTFNSPLSRSVNAVSIPQATGSVNGFLSATDWTTFNSKENALTFSSPLVRTTNAISIPQATGSVSGFLSSTDWTTFNSKQAALGFTPANAATTLTINGVTFDLSQNRTWTIAAGISGSGASGQVTYWTGASAVSGSNNLFWDNTNSRLGIGTNTPTNSINIVNGRLDISGTSSVSGSGISIGYLTGTYAWIQSWVSRPIALNPNGNNVTIGVSGGADNGQRLQVYGDTLLRGSGATSATTALTVQNSSSTNLFTVRNDGAVAIGSTPSTSFKAVIGGSLQIIDTANTPTRVEINNTTSGSNSFAYIHVESDINSGGADFGKYSTLKTGFKTIAAKDFFVFNNSVGGNITFLNDNANGNVNFAAGGASSPHLTIKSNGRINMSSLPTSSTGLAAGDLWNNAGVINIV